MEVKPEIENRKETAFELGYKKKELKANNEDESNYYKMLIKNIRIRSNG
ncbi:MAG: hypothetical protein U5N58_00970 [Actinomycetota bacterium]|nr:hypothetical protein [Actinomycetota bacterium]